MRLGPPRRPTRVIDLLNPAAVLASTTGFLPQEFREHMQLRWSGREQRRLETLLTGLRVIDRVVPRDVWVLGYRLYLRDMRTRMRLGRRVV